MTPQKSPSTASADSAEQERSNNPLLAPWAGPYGGVAPFDAIRPEHFEPAFRAAMEEMRREIDAIAASPAAPTFENTLAALEDAGRTFRAVETCYHIWTANLGGPEVQAVEREMAPRLAAFEDEITQNEPLFRRIEAIWTGPEKEALSPEQRRLAWVQHTRFVRSGARLDAAAKRRLAEINARLASLYTDFAQNVLADEESFVVLESEADLAGLPDSLRSAAAAAAEAKGLAGKWVIANTRSAVEPFLAYSDRRDLREKVWRAFVQRGDNGGPHDNNAVITEILALRAERAGLLGYPTHAHYRLEDTMAKTPERAMQLMEAVWEPAVARSREEVADMQALAGAPGASTAVEPWDHRYYAEKVRKARYDLDQNDVKPYLQLDKLREGMFWVAGELFDLVFTPAPDVPVFHPDVRVWEVTDRRTGKHVGLWYFDPYARPGKRSGAWMSLYRAQERFRREIPAAVSNNASFLQGRPGEPVLIGWADAETLFHEFGHALHGLLSNITYPRLSINTVPADYVEFPSQLLEHWLPTPEVLGRFALHHATGAPMPPELVARIRKAATFNQGFATVEYLSAALVDMKLHLSGTGPVDPRAFERDALRALGMPREIVMRHRTPHFSHVFATDEYSAGYYSYLWSDTLTADAFEAFTEASGPYDRDVAASLRQHVFEAGNTVDPAEGYRAFRGRDAGTAALMRKRGFAVPGAAAKTAP